MMAIIANGFASSIQSSQALVNYAQLFSDEMIPESESEWLLKNLQIAVSEVHRQDSVAPFAQVALGQLEMMRNNSALATEAGIAIEELEEARDTLIIETLALNMPQDDWAGVLAFLPSLAGGQRGAAVNEKHACKKYTWYIPFYINPPLEQSFTCGNDTGGTTILCGAPTDGCRKCASENVCMACCNYFGSGTGSDGNPSRCQLNCGDASIAGHADD
jgi:hypothetical protein